MESGAQRRLALCATVLGQAALCMVYVGGMYAVGRDERQIQRERVGIERGMGIQAHGKARDGRLRTCVPADRSPETLTRLPWGVYRLILVSVPLVFI